MFEQLPRLTWLLACLGIAAFDAAVLWIISFFSVQAQRRALQEAGDSRGGPVAGFWIRFAARIADYAFLLLLVVIALTAAALADAKRVAGPWVWAVGLSSPVWIFALYFAVLTALCGQTLGKLFAGLRVERLDRGRLGWGMAIIRALTDGFFVMAAHVLIGLIDPLLVAFSGKRRAIHDLAAGSVVRARAAPSLALPWVAALAPFVLVFYLAVVRPALVQLNYIPSESMAPALRPGDRILVNKLAYHLEPVRRGDIVTIHAPPSATLDSAPRTFVSRVVALPGDSVLIERGQGVFINGKRLDEPYAAAPEYDWPAGEWGQALGQPYVVPQDACIVLGDNRNRANDSHMWGPLPLSNIIGRVSCVWWPPRK